MDVTLPALGGQMVKNLANPGKGWGALGLIFAGYVPLASQNPYLILVYSMANIITDSILVTFRQICIFVISTQSLSIYECTLITLNKEHFTFHLQYKQTGAFANGTYEELS